MGAFEEFQAGRDGDGADEVGVDGVPAFPCRDHPFPVGRVRDHQGDGGVIAAGDPGDGRHTASYRLV